MAEFRTDIRLSPSMRRLRDDRSAQSPIQRLLAHLLIRGRIRPRPDAGPRAAKGVAGLRNPVTTF